MGNLRSQLSFITSGLVLLGLFTIAAPAEAAGTFADDDGSVFEAAIEAIANAGITKGCNPPENTNYCPDQNITRGEMAAFLKRALKLPPTTTNQFTDDDGSVFEAAIEAIANAGITKGCNPPENTNYCPDQNITRGEMAAFLKRALNLPVEPPVEPVDPVDPVDPVEPPIEPPPPVDPVDPVEPPIEPPPPVDPVEPPIEPPPPVDPTVVFAAGGDIGANDEAAAVLEAIAGSEAEFFLALGDLSYSQVEPESAWCDWMRARLGDQVNIEMIVGNHEDDRLDDGADDGSWVQFAQCLPDTMTSTGEYPNQYFFDVRDMVRVIMLSADVLLDSRTYSYKPGSDEAAWLTDAIRSARTAGIKWIVVGTHKPCISVGTKNCEAKPDLTQLLMDEKVDLMVVGHDHTYQRTRQLTCITVADFDPGCVADSDDDLNAGAGTVMVVAGTFRAKSNYNVSSTDPEVGYFADYMGLNSPDNGSGYVEITAAPENLTVRFVGVTSAHTDTFVIHK